MNVNHVQLSWSQISWKTSHVMQLRQSDPVEKRYLHESAGGDGFNPHLTTLLASSVTAALAVCLNDMDCCLLFLVLYTFHLPSCCFYLLGFLKRGWGGEVGPSSIYKHKNE